MSFRRVWRSAASLFSLPVKRERNSSWKRSPVVKVMATARERASATVFPLMSECPRSLLFSKGMAKVFPCKTTGCRGPGDPSAAPAGALGAQDLGEGLADVDEAPHALKDELASSISLPTVPSRAPLIWR